VSAASETVIGMTAILGYARVSTTGQELDAQLAILTAAGVDTERVFTDKWCRFSSPVSFSDPLTFGDASCLT
jgi:hypothetical protein